MDSITIAIAAGISLGVIAGYHGSRVLIRTAGEPYASSATVVGLAIFGAASFMIPAVMFSLTISRRAVESTGQPIADISATTLVAIALGNAIVIGSGLVVGAVASALSGKMIELWRAGRGR